MNFTNTSFKTTVSVVHRQRVQSINIDFETGIEIIANYKMYHNLYNVYKKITFQIFLTAGSSLKGFNLFVNAAFYASLESWLLNLHVKYESYILYIINFLWHRPAHKIYFK